MHPQIQRREAFSIAGLTTRTCNEDERDPRSARIGKLWERFFDEARYEAPHRVNDMRLYGVYSGYESDADGKFDMTAGVAVMGDPATVRIEAGDYLVFSGQGPMPQMVLALWQSIWQYFEANPGVRRTYRSDFESYGGPDQVDIHIGVLTASES
ncbi:GyrI-like domain-containing protein [Variovorax sp. OV329]|uniref:GyrI-like domain-containing protein n=1 Tax=Variovorax sp. OV329 TaxID=1882825 RepID=UPI0008E4E6E1|nr:GyrI-like domain-containing protein [Variovorax sp. OV329]SFM54972.1 Predicted transcriptional regulator YdeE, contains AraC-type DNA-binding domain [Variovorax sp. OV329]